MSDPWRSLTNRSLATLGQGTNGLSRQSILRPSHGTQVADTLADKVTDVGQNEEDREEDRGNEEDEERDEGLHYQVYLHSDSHFGIPRS